MAPIVVVQGLSCPSASGIFPDQGSNTRPLIGRWLLIPWTTRKVPFCVLSGNRRSGVVTGQNTEAAQGNKVYCIHEPQRGGHREAAVQSGGRKQGEGRAWAVVFTGVSTGKARQGGLNSWGLASLNHASRRSGNEVTQSCPTPCDPTNCSPPGSSIHGIFPARILEWVAISISRGSSQPRDRTRVSRIVGRCFNRLSHQGSQQIHI